MNKTNNDPSKMETEEILQTALEERGLDKPLDEVRDAEWILMNQPSRGWLRQAHLEGVRYRVEAEDGGEYRVDVEKIQPEEI